MFHEQTFGEEWLIKISYKNDKNFTKYCYNYKMEKRQKKKLKGEWGGG